MTPLPRHSSHQVTKSPEVQEEVDKHTGQPGAARRHGAGAVVPGPDGVCRACYAHCSHGTGQDAGALSSRKTPAARALMPVAACEQASISKQHLKDAWHLQIRFREDAAALGTLKKNGSRPGYLREHIAEGLTVVQRLLGQSNTVQRLQTDGRPDTQGGLVSVSMRPPLSRWHFRPAPPRQICVCCVVLCVRAVCETDCGSKVNPICGSKFWSVFGRFGAFFGRFGAFDAGSKNATTIF